MCILRACVLSSELSMHVRTNYCRSEIYTASYGGLPSSRATPALTAVSGSATDFLCSDPSIIMQFPPTPSSTRTCIMYADDLLLLSPSVNGLQSMLDICSVYGGFHYLMLQKRLLCQLVVI
jgi:hypothetical protein